jgi:putative oxidoreductase
MTGRVYRLAGVVRILVGVLFLGTGVLKFVDYGGQVALFEAWNVPLPGLAVGLVGVVEVVAGALLAAGIAMPLPAFVLAADMLGALLTAGLAVGGPQLVAPLTLLVALGFVLSRWGGAWQRGTARGAR